MHKYRVAIAALLLSSMTGCSPQDNEPSANAAGDEPQHVWKDQVQTLDKARAVEQTLMDAQQRNIETLREAE